MKMAMKRSNVCVGNYMVSNYAVGDMKVYEVSNLAKTWLVRLPADFQMYGILERLMKEYQSKNKERKEKAQEVLDMFFMNWQNVTGVPNGYYHQAIVLLTAAYMKPELLGGGLFDNKEQRGFKRDITNLRKTFLQWHKELKAHEDAADRSINMKQEALADDAKQRLLKEEEGKES